MKWFLLIGFSLSLTGLCCGRVLRCASDSKEPSCLSEEEEKDKLKLPRGKQCAVGTYWTTECNVCVCETSGIATCTKVGCEPERSLVCAPGSRWMDDCNACTCNDGQPVCTLKLCPTSAPKDSSTEKEPLLAREGRDCAPGTSWETECNTCICSPKGYPMCTLNSCPIERKRRCALETFWQNECNSCACNDGEPICTTADCFSGTKTSYINLPDVLPEVTECKPGSSWKTECDDCSCQLDGHALCINLRCQNDPVVFEESSTKKNTEINTTLVRKVRDNSQNSALNRKTRGYSQEPAKACQPGSEFRMDCNKCLCDNEGQDFSCTRIDCNAQNNNNNGGLRSKRDITEKISSDCTPGTVFEKGCNVCRCTGKGEALCTTNKCKEHTEETTNTVPDSEVDSNFRCNPGEQFNFECNDCTCSADGRGVFCTLRFCDQSLNPDI